MIGFAALAETPLAALASPSVIDASISEGLAVADTSTADLIAMLIERLRTADTLTPLRSLQASLAEEIVTGDGVTVGYVVFLSESIAVDDVATAIRVHFAQLVEVLIASGLADCARTAFADLIEAAVLADLVYRGFDAEMLEAAEMADEIAATTRRIAALVESIQLEDTTTGYFSLVAVLDESLEVADAFTATRALFAQLSEGLVLYGSIALDGEIYRCWVLSMRPTETGQAAAVVEYQNFPFDCFTEFNGRYYGGNAQGLFQLFEGSDDDGEPIEAWIRSGLSNFGTGKAKRMPSLYLGYSGDGTLVLKAITTSETDGRVEDWYQLTPRASTAAREARIKLGRGLKSVFWGFELRAVGDVAIDVIEWQPLILDRRLT